MAGWDRGGGWRGEGVGQGPGDSLMVHVPSSCITCMTGGCLSLYGAAVLLYSRSRQGEAETGRQARGQANGGVQQKKKNVTLSVPSVSLLLRKAGNSFVLVLKE